MIEITITMEAAIRLIHELKELAIDNDSEVSKLYAMLQSVTGEWD